MGMSKLSKKCRECKYVDTCEHKRMEALAYINEVSTIEGVNATASIMQPHNYRDIKIDNNITVSIDLDGLHKEINQRLYGNAFKINI